MNVNPKSILKTIASFLNKIRFGDMLLVEGRGVDWCAGEGMESDIRRVLIWMKYKKVLISI